MQPIAPDSVQPRATGSVQPNATDSVIGTDINARHPDWDKHLPPAAPVAQRARAGTRTIQSAWSTEAPAPSPRESTPRATPTRGARRRRLLRMLWGS